ncbi:MAG: hypothetical protein OSB21_07860, partial [Myxococcota bacterium]|nr:hypothetical protein [Myxococcota bacterium]
MKHIFCSLMLFAGCGGSPLPLWPEGNRPGPIVSEIRFGVVSPATTTAGQWVEMPVEVIDQYGEPMVGQIVTASLPLPEDLRKRIVDFSAGNSCVTGSEPVLGACSMSLYAPGPIGEVGVRFSAGAVSAELVIRVGPAIDRPLAIIEVGTRDPLVWQPGDPDRLSDRPRLLLGVGARPTALRIRLVDPFGNAVVEPLITLRLVSTGVPHRSDAGPATADAASATDAQGTNDVAALRNDGGPADAALVDGRILDVSAEPRLDASQSDASNQGEGLLPKVNFLAPGGRGCVDASGSIGSQRAGSDGALFCLSAGSFGRWELQVEIDGLTQVGSIAEAPNAYFLRLRGETLPGLPARIAMLASHLSCAPGDLSAELQARVETEEGRAVSGQLVLASLSELAGLEPSSATSDGLGLVRFRARCPYRAVTEGRLTLTLADHRQVQAAVAVRTHVGALETLRFVRIAGQTDEPKRVGMPILLAVSGYDLAGQAVPNIPLRFRIVDAAQNNSLQLNGTALAGQTLSSGAGARLRLDLLSAGRTTAGAPIELIVSAVGSRGQLVWARKEIHLIPGQPARLSSIPAGILETGIGSVAGHVIWKVFDASDNPVGGVPISVEPGANLVLNARSGRSDASGELRSVIRRVGAQGEHLLSAATDAGLTASLTVQAGGLEAAQLRLLRLPPGAEAEELPLFEGRPIVELTVAQAYPGVLGLRVLNSAGGGLAGRGFSAVLVDPAQAVPCGSWPVWQGLVSANDGTVTLDSGLQAGSVAVDCLWRLQVGVASLDVVLRQRPGAPRGGSIEVSQDGELWQPLAGGEPFGALPVNPQRPGRFEPGRSLWFRLTAHDRYGNSLGGAPVRISVANGYVESIMTQFDEQSRIVGKLAGGAVAGVDARISLMSTKPWEEHPSLRFWVVPTAPVLSTLNPTVVILKPYDDRPETLVTIALQLEESRVVLPQDAWDDEGLCNDSERCTQVQLLWLDDGDVRLPEPQLLATLPLRQNGNSFQVVMNKNLLNRGVLHGLRLVSPDRGRLLYSAIVDLRTPRQPVWLGQKLRLLPAENDPAIDLYVEHLFGADANGDGRDELIACGTDSRGAWALVAPVDHDSVTAGSVPFSSRQMRVTRTYSVPDDWTDAERRAPRFEDPGPCNHCWYSKVQYGDGSCAVIGANNRRYLVTKGKPASNRTQFSELIILELHAEAPFLRPPEAGYESLALTGVSEGLVWWKLARMNQNGTAQIELCTGALDNAPWPPQRRYCTAANSLRATVRISDSGTALLTENITLLEAPLRTPRVEMKVINLNNDRWPEHCGRRWQGTNNYPAHYAECEHTRSDNVFDAAPYGSQVVNRLSRLRQAPFKEITKVEAAVRWGDKEGLLTGEHSWIGWA